MTDHPSYLDQHFLVDELRELPDAELRDRLKSALEQNTPFNNLIMNALAGELFARTLEQQGDRDGAAAAREAQRGHRPYFEVRLDVHAFIHNLHRYARHVEEKMPGENGIEHLIVTVKSGAYGHGGIEMAHAALEAGATMLSVDDVPKGISLRDSGVDQAEILCLYPPPLDEHYELAVAGNIMLTIGSLDDFHRLQDAIDKYNALEVDRPKITNTHRFKIHIKIDSGMHRYGIEPGQALTLIQAIRKDERIEIQGIFTHFARADMLEDKHMQFTRQQFETFLNVLRELHAQGIEIPIVHIANSAAHWNFQDAFDPEQIHAAYPGCKIMTRPGIGLYGPPSTPGFDTNDVGIEQVMTVRTRMQKIEKVPAGEGIGYASRGPKPYDQWVAIVAGGYADGLRRDLHPNEPDDIHWWVIVKRSDDQSNATPIRCFDDKGDPLPDSDFSRMEQLPDGGVLCPIAATIAMNGFVIRLPDQAAAQRLVRTRDTIVEIIGPHNPAQAMADELGTLPHPVVLGFAAAAGQRGVTYVK